MADFDKNLAARALEKTGAKNYDSWLNPEPYENASRAPVESSSQTPVSYAPSAEVNQSVAPPPASEVAPAPAASAPVTITVGGPAPAAAPTPAPKPAAKPHPKPAPAPAAPAPTPVAPPAPGQVPTDEQLLNPGAPDAPPPPEAPPVTSQNDGIEDKAYSPAEKTKELQGDVAAADARKLDMLGEGTQAIEETTGKNQAIEATRSEAAVGSIEKSRERQDDVHARSEEMRERQETELADLKQRMGNPPFDTVGMVFGIVSALAAANGKPGAAQAFQSLGNAVNIRMQKYRQGIEAGEKNLEGMGKLVTLDRLNAASEDEAEGLITKAVAAEFDAGFDAVGRDAKSDAERRAVEQGKNQLRQALAQQELGARGKAAAAARRAKIYDRIGHASTEEERRQIADQYKGEGQSIYRDFLKTSKDTTGVAENIVGTELKGAQIGETLANTQLKQAQAGKAEAEAKVGPAQEWAPKGWAAPAGISPQLSTKVGDLATKKAQVASAYNRLMEIAEGVEKGKISKTDAGVIQEVADIRNGLVSMKTTFTGAGAPTGAEYDQTISTIADPQKWVSRAKQSNVVARAARNLENSYGSALRELGYTPATAGGPAAPVAASGKVRVVAPDGTELSLTANQAAALRKTNPAYRLADETE